jgi:hypothetical protein
VDGHRLGTWAAKLLRLSSASRPKRQAGVRRSAQTLGRMETPAFCKSPFSHLQAPPNARTRVSQVSVVNQSQARAFSSARPALLSHRMPPALPGICVRESVCCSGQSVCGAAWRRRNTMPAVSARWSRAASPAESVRVQRLCSLVLALCQPSARAHRAKLRPNPSLEWTCTGMALGPRGYSGHHPPRGPSATPAPAPQLKR